jgi:hypothetical protein
MRHAIRIVAWLAVSLPLLASAQIDPVKRDLIQFGYNQPLQGAEPLAAYAYYYRNDPNFCRTNLTLRLAVAPVYVDSELGFVHGLGPQTDFAIGVAGGGFADSYNEIDGGKWIKNQSFDGHGGEVSSSIYHLFNPNDMIPLNFVLRGTAHYSLYEANDDTASKFHVPSDAGIFSLRTGLRYGGIEPTLFPSLAMELSAWYQGSYRTESGTYGFNGDHTLEPDSHLFWGAAALAYTLDKSKQTFFVQAIAGTSLNADRMTAYRLGGFLPLSAEYPLSIPGFYYQELSARQFALINASYLVPIAPNQRWNLYLNAATADVGYLPGTDSYQTPSGAASRKDPNWVSGVGGGILYRSPHDRFKFMVTYAYGIDALRSGGGASTIGMLFQINLEKSHNSSRFDARGPGQYNGWNWLLGR